MIYSSEAELLLQSIVECMMKLSLREDVEYVVEPHM
jgi:hypothetical protein